NSTRLAACPTASRFSVGCSTTGCSAVWESRSSARLASRPTARLAFDVTAACLAVERHDAARADGLVGGEDDPQALHRVVHVRGDVEILVDRPQQETLFAFAELVV